MFQSLGKFFKNLYTGVKKRFTNGGRANNSAPTAAEQTTTLAAIRSGNGHISHFTWSNKAHDRNKKERNRMRSKMARQSRNAQHRKAA